MDNIAYFICSIENTDTILTSFCIFSVIKEQLIDFLSNFAAKMENVRWKSFYPLQNLLKINTL